MPLIGKSEKVRRAALSFIFELASWEALVALEVDSDCCPVEALLEVEFGVETEVEMESDIVKEEEIVVEGREGVGNV